MVTAESPLPFLSAWIGKSGTSQRVFSCRQRLSQLRIGPGTKGHPAGDFQTADPQAHLGNGARVGRVFVFQGLDEVGDLLGILEVLEGRAKSFGPRDQEGNPIVAANERVEHEAEADLMRTVAVVVDFVAYQAGVEQVGLWAAARSRPSA